MNITTMTDDTGMAPKDSLWTAIDYDTYDDGSGPIGSGATEDEAIADLMEKLTD